MAVQRRQLWGGISDTSKAARPGTLPAGDGQRSGGKTRRGLRLEGTPPSSAHCPPTPPADSSAGTASFSPAPVQPEHQGAGARRHPSLRVYLVPFIRERQGVNPRPGEGCRAGETLSLTWSVASGICSLNPGKARGWGGWGG